MRAISLLLIQHNGKILAEKGSDSVQGTEYFRMIGGGIEDGERAVEAVRRELMEELGVETTNEKVVTVIENIFTYEGKPGHEIVFLCTGDFADPKNYSVVRFQILDKPGRTAEWVSIEDLKSRKSIIYPEKILDYLCS